MLFQLHVFVLATFAMGAFALLQPGQPCTTAGQCEPGQYTGTRFCCASPLGGSYCSECCYDGDCPPVAGRVRICVPGYPYYSGLKHSRFCGATNAYPSGEPCFRNDMCISGNCIGNRGQCGDVVQLPFGKCA